MATFEQLYMYDLNIIPDNHKQTFVELNDSITRAMTHPGKVVRHAPEWYFVFVNGELVEIEKLDEGPAKGMWIAREANQKWYSDPYDTYAEVKEGVIGN